MIATSDRIAGLLPESIRAERRFGVGRIGIMLAAVNMRLPGTPFNVPPPEVPPLPPTVGNHLPSPSNRPETGR